jgi:3-deoxy-D-manno-octulosonic acid (KDO) 8-phosphate synthase
MVARFKCREVRRYDALSVEGKDAVLGVNDGLVSTASLMVGVAAASASLDNAKAIIISTGIAGIAAGADGLFIETHPNPSVALSDGANMLALHKLENLLEKMCILKEAINKIDKL